MSELDAPSLDELPGGPGAPILRAAEVGLWQDGYRFLAAARATRDRMEEQARDTYEESRARGHEEGRAAGAIEASRLVAATVVKVDRYLAGLEQEVAALAIGIVRRVLGECDAVDLVARAATHALGEFRHEKWLKITVHPDAVEQVRARLAAIVHDNGPILTISGDPSLGASACILVSEFAVVDASIDIQLAAMAKALGCGDQGAA
jgi:type III secretion protein L